MSLTPREIEAAVTKARRAGGDRWLSDDDGTRDGWRLVLRAMPSGAARWYFRYTRQGRRDVVPVGNYPALSLKAARLKATALAQTYATDRNVKAVLAETEAQREAGRRARDMEQQRRQEHTLRALVALYVEHLRRNGKSDTARNVESLTRCHLGPLADQPAADVTRQEIADRLRQVIEAGKGRTAGKLRAYLRAAYALALRAETDASAPAAMAAFARAGVSHNPAAETAALTRYNRQRERALSDGELLRLWDYLGDADVYGLAVRSAIALGGQRIAQLTRAEVSDVRDGWLRLHDAKGRRAEPREHAVPLVGIAADLMQWAMARAHQLGSRWLFSATGAVPISPDTLSAVVRRISAVMLEAGEATAPFQLRDLRRTVETKLAALGVSSDVRAHLLSHGLGGIQTRHYDRHDYAAEKRDALTRLHQWIERRGDLRGKVVPLRRGK